MKKLSRIGAVLCFLLPVYCAAQPSAEEIKRWEEQSRSVTIIRDNWGIPHVYGETDADAVFGLVYAQCEDDFNRVEMNFIEKLGRLSELKGEKSLAHDLMIRLLIDSAEAEKDYKAAPAWLRKLLDAHADGINYYLYKHPGLRPAMITRFKPWYHLLWTDGSIGAINTAGVSEKEIADLYLGNGPFSALEDIDRKENPSGSNGFAIAPLKSASGKAMLYINPHVTFYFRPEVHMQSGEGLNAYGAVTWGQLFVYQGFNEYCGWMHTSGYSDNADLYIEKVKQGKRPTYLYEGKRKRLVQKKITLSYSKDGKLLNRTLTSYYTHHGPLLARRNGEYLSLRAMNRDVKGLIQCWQRTKAKGLEDFKKSMELFANPTNNTVFADKDGNIAYFHGNFHPRRDKNTDWTKPVDGTLKKTEWAGVHSLAEGINIYNPPNGWLQSCNSSPFTAAGPGLISKDSFPSYMGPDGDNFRSQNAIELMGRYGKLDMDALIKIGYNRTASAFDVILPYLNWAFFRTRGIKDSAYLAGPIAVLRNWLYQCSETSVATTLAVHYGEKLLPLIYRADTRDYPTDDFINKTFAYCKAADPVSMIDTLRVVLKELELRHGTWAVPWGEINRMQRIGNGQENIFSDSLQSIPIAYVSSVWGMLPSLGSHYFPGTKKRYAVSGNSFVCAVEFGDSIKARSLLAGGQSGDPSSAHYFEQAKLFSQGKFKEVKFYRKDVEAAAERSYHPGE